MAGIVNIVYLNSPTKRPYNDSDIFIQPNFVSVSHYLVLLSILGNKGKMIITLPGSRQEVNARQA